MAIDDPLMLAADTAIQGENQTPNQASKTWKILIVDDEEEIHVVTRLALHDFTFGGRQLEFISAYSGAEAKTMVRDNPDVAIILLDVVMETDSAGLDVA